MNKWTVIDKLRHIVFEMENDKSKSEKAINDLKSLVNELHESYKRER